MRQNYWNSIFGLGCWTGSRIREQDVLAMMPKKVQNVSKSHRMSGKSCRCQTGSRFSKLGVVMKRRKKPSRVPQRRRPGRPLTVCMHVCATTCDVDRSSGGSDRGPASAWTGVEGRSAIAPPPRAPAGDPTPITPSVARASRHGFACCYFQHFECSDQRIHMLYL